jgi:2-aminoethylphosphonate-pyruvate transaminase
VAAEAGVRTAVILAAGVGRRLAGRGRVQPKGFLTLGDRPIVEESVVRLLRAGVQRVVIVTGHLAGFYEGLRQRFPDRVETVHNPRYADSGSMYSLYLAGDRLGEDFLLLESDLIYEQRALTTLQAAAGPDVILLSGFTGAGDEVYVESREGFLVQMSKRRGALGAEPVGELVGISRISRRLYARMREFFEPRLGRDLNLDYETDCLVGVAPQAAIRCHVVPDLLWAEIDDEAHLERARREVYPRILERDGGP